MKKNTIPFIAFACLSLFFSAACRKEKKTTSCSSTLYATRITDTNLLAPTTDPFFGTTDPSTLSSTPTTSYPLYIYSNQAAFNPSDNSYYIFRYGNSSYTNKLFRISASGSVSTILAASNMLLEGLIFNPTNNKLYCLKRISGSSTTEIAEVVISGSTFTLNTVCTTSHVSTWVSPASSTINNITGEMYFSLQEPISGYYSLEKYTPGASATTVMSSGTGANFLGLRYNSNDNMLYALASDTTGIPSGSSYRLAKISPATGAISMLSTVPFYVNNEFYSTALDPCSNRYLVSSVLPYDASIGYIRVMRQMNMSGSTVQYDTTSALFQGMFVKY